MKKITPLQQLLSKEVNRKEFLTIAGFGLLSLFGLSTLVHMLTGKSSSSHIASTTSNAYSTRKYGD